MPRKIVVLMLAFSISAFASEYATLKHISDGDTMIFKTQGLKEVKCRVYGIDTPEKFHTAKLTKDASKIGVTKELLEKVGKLSTDYANRTLDIGRSYKIDILDKIGERYLCNIYLGNKTYNEIIVQDGYAVVYEGGKYIKEADLKYRLIKAQQEAKRNNRGLWNGYKKVMEGME